MPQVEIDNATIHYELMGDPQKPTVMLLAGLGGAGATMWPQVTRFAERYHLVLPDQRGTGQSSRPDDGHSVTQNAKDMAAVLRHAGAGPAHLVGSSIGGAIAQVLALDHEDLVASLTVTTGFARADAYMRRTFSVLRHLMGQADLPTVYAAYAMVLFAPEYARANPQGLDGWIDFAASLPAERDLAMKRIDMVMAHDVLDRLGAIRRPTCVVSGDCDVLTPQSLSMEIAEATPGAELHVVEGGGHMIHTEQEARYFEIVGAFIDAR